MSHHHHHPHHGAAAAGAFACAVCGSHEATPNQDDELVCDICGTLSQVRCAGLGWVGLGCARAACVIKASCHSGRHLSVHSPQL